MDFEIIEIAYNGRMLKFYERDDKWSCHELKLEAKSLTALKRKIDKLDGEARRVSVSAVQIGNGGYYSKVGSPAQIVMLAKRKEWELMRYDEKPNVGFATNSDERRVPSVWVMVPSGNHPPERRKMRLDELAFPSESVQASIREYERLGAEIKQLEAAREAVLKGIPRLTIDDLAPKGVKEENLDGDE
jgi:hypothetical protein